MTLTQTYLHLARHPEEIAALPDEQLLQNYDDTQLMLATDSGMASNRLRIDAAETVAHLQRTEIRRRMEAHHQT